MKNEISLWKDFHEYWIKKYEERYPVFFIRYEDLVEKPQTVIEDAFCFILGVESIEGTALQ